jgi:signal transduction histidine kinase
MKKSIRKRLTIMLATVAFLVATLIGGIMYSTLYKYYSAQENQFLKSNAVIIEENLKNSQFENEITDSTEIMLTLLSIISNTQIKLYNTENVQLFDSGTPQNFSSTFLEGDSSTIIFSDNFLLAQNTGTELMSSGWIESTDQVIPFEEDHQIISSLNFPIDISSTEQNTIQRSSKTINYPLHDNNNQLIGFLELSNPPAYGRTIMRSIIRGWAIAAIASLLVTSISGFWISKRFSKPIEELTQTTNQMAQGNLSIRTTIEQQDEVGDLAQAFNSMADNIEKNIKILKRFVADAAHELNTPLTALRANLELERNQENKIVIKQVDCMVSLTKALLDLSKLEVNEQKTQKENTDLTQILSAISETYATKAEAKDITYLLTIENQPIIFYCNTEEITTLFSNFIDNAIKFTPSYGTVKVSLKQTDYQIIFIVQDNGIGIPPEDIPQLFSRFHRGKNSASFNGSGLGLAIAKTIADLYDAHIQVSSQENNTQFILTL